MVLEKIFQPYWIEKRPIYSLYLGMIFAVFGFLTAFLLFRSVLGLAAIFFTVMLALPSINVLLKYEEYIETEIHESFFKQHENIFDIFLYFFLGVFLIFVVVGLVNTSFLYNAGIVIAPPDKSDLAFLADLGDLPPPPVLGGDGSLAKTPFLNLNMGKVYSIILNNLYVMIVAFALSLFYGAGALFLIIFNASVWASVITQVIKLKTSALGLGAGIIAGGCNISIMMLHAIPEMAAYLLAAIGGGVLAKAFIKEGIKSPNFWKVFKDAIILMVLAILVTIVSGFIEVGVSEKLFNKDVCSTSQLIFIIIGAVIVAIVIILEILRWRHKKGKPLFSRSNPDAGSTNSNVNSSVQPKKTLNSPNSVNKTNNNQNSPNKEVQKNEKV